MVIQVRKSNRSLTPVTQSAPNVARDDSVAQSSLEGLGNATDLLVTGIKNKADFKKKKAERILDYDNASALDAQNTADTLFAEKQVGLRKQVDTGEVNANEYITKSNELFTETTNDVGKTLQNAQQQNIYKLYSEAQKDKLSPEELEYQARAITNFNLKASADKLEEAYSFSLSTQNDESLTKNYEYGKVINRTLKPEMSEKEADANFSAGYANNITTSLSAEGRINPGSAMGKATYNLNKDYISQDQYNAIYDTTISTSRFSEIDMAGNIAYKRFGDDRASAYAQIEESIPSVFFEDNKDYTKGLIEEKKVAYDNYKFEADKKNRVGKNKATYEQSSIVEKAVFSLTPENIEAAEGVIRNLSESGMWAEANTYREMLRTAVSANPAALDNTEVRAQAMIATLAGDQDGLIPADAQQVINDFGYALDEKTMSTMRLVSMPQDSALSTENKDIFEENFKLTNGITKEEGTSYKYTEQYYNYMVNAESMARQSMSSGKDIDAEASAMILLAREENLVERKKRGKDKGKFKTYVDVSNPVKAAEAIGVKEEAVTGVWSFDEDIFTPEIQAEALTALFSIGTSPKEKEALLQDIQNQMTVTQEMRAEEDVIRDSGSFLGSYFNPGTPSGDFIGEASDVAGDIVRGWGMMARDVGLPLVKTVGSAIESVGREVFNVDAISQSFSNVNMEFKARKAMDRDHDRQEAAVKWGAKKYDEIQKRIEEQEAEAEKQIVEGM